MTSHYLKSLININNINCGHLQLLYVAIFLWGKMEGFVHTPCVGRDIIRKHLGSRLKIYVQPKAESGTSQETSAYKTLRSHSRKLLHDKSQTMHDCVFKHVKCKSSSRPQPHHLPLPTQIVWFLGLGWWTRSYTSSQSAPCRTSPAQSVCFGAAVSSSYEQSPAPDAVALSHAEICFATK